MSFFWDEEKNKKLKEERGISFERIVISIEEGHIVDILENPNKEKYKNQMILLIDIENYIFCVPCIFEKNGDICLKTIFPSRKYISLYLEGGH